MNGYCHLSSMERRHAIQEGLKDHGESLKEQAEEDLHDRFLATWAEAQLNQIDSKHSNHIAPCFDEECGKVLAYLIDSHLGEAVEFVISEGAQS